MERVSEFLRKINLQGLKITGILVNDVIELCKLNDRNPDTLPQGMSMVLGLRIKLGIPLIVHQLTEAVCQKVQHIKIESLPTEYPTFLKKPFFIEAKPDKVLFDDIDAIGGFIDDNDEFILVIWSKYGTHFTKTKTPFSGIRLDQINFALSQGSYIPPADQNKNIFPFITVLALMLEAEKTPILIDHGTKKSRKRNQIKNKKNDPSDWIEKRIYIDGKYSNKTVKVRNPMDKDGKEKLEVNVKGFLRHQAYGPEHSLRKLIYIEEHESTRWKKPGDRKITLDTRF